MRRSESTHRHGAAEITNPHLPPPALPNLPRKFDFAVNGPRNLIPGSPFPPIDLKLLSFIPTRHMRSNPNFILRAGSIALERQITIRPDHQSTSTTKPKPKPLLQHKLSYADMLKQPQRRQSYANIKQTLRASQSLANLSNGVTLKFIVGNVDFSAKDFKQRVFVTPQEVDLSEIFELPPLPPKLAPNFDHRNLKCTYSIIISLTVEYEGAIAQYGREYLPVSVVPREVDEIAHAREDDSMWEADCFYDEKTPWLDAEKEVRTKLKFWDGWGEIV